MPNDDEILKNHIRYDVVPLTLEEVALSSVLLISCFQFWFQLVARCIGSFWKWSNRLDSDKLPLQQTIRNNGYGVQSKEFRNNIQSYGWMAIF